MSPRLVAAFILLLTTPIVDQAEAQFQPNVRPSLEVAPATGPIVVDGRLDDPGWSGAATAQDWQEIYPEYNAAPGIGLRGRMTYDDENLYVAVVVDEDPAALRASMRDRDEIWRDDYVGLIVDTYGTGAWAYQFFVNPYGVQGDVRWTPGGEDERFDVVWTSEAHVTDTGWQVEIAVPFRSLRFPDRERQSWRATWWYNRSRGSRERYSWSAADRDDPCWPCTWGTIEGIAGVESGGALELLPSVTGYTSSGLSDPNDPASNFERIDRDTEIGLGLRYGINSSLSVEGTLNPDFSQVESDAAQVDVNTTLALFFPERRPFFQEGSDIYQTPIDAVYTRTLNNPLWATKLTGRTERSSVGLLVGRDEDSPVILPFEERSIAGLTGGSTSVIGRARRTLYGDSYVGVLGTARNVDGGGHNGLGGVDGLFRFRDVYYLQGQVLLSRTEEIDAPDFAGGLWATDAGGDLLRFDVGGTAYTQALDGEDFGGDAAFVEVGRSARFWSLALQGSRLSEGFRADNGFIDQNDREQLVAIANATVEVNDRGLDEIRPFLYVTRIWNVDGVRKDEFVRASIDFDLKGQTNLRYGHYLGRELFGGVELRDVERWDLRLTTRFSEYVDGGVEYIRGDIPARFANPIRLGDGQIVLADLAVKPPWRGLGRLTVDTSFEWQRLEDPATGSIEAPGFFEGYVWRTRLNFQATRSFFARLVVQRDGFTERLDFEPLLTYRVDPFTLVYAGASTRWTDFSRIGTSPEVTRVGFEESERQFFVKVQAQLRN